jgi:hypothetical protein
MAPVATLMGYSEHRRCKMAVCWNLRLGDSETPKGHNNAKGMKELAVRVKDLPG